MKYLSLLALIIAFTVNAFSQRVVISEYFNQINYPNGEWTEFLVLEDGTSLVNCIFRDNQEALSAWQGGVQFKNVPLWTNLKRGTIIVLEHRSLEKTETLDTNSTDGYLHVSALDDNLFTLFTPTPDPDPSRTWDQKALNIANASDIMQICEADGTHIHSLSHYAQQSSSMWQGLPTPKPNMPTSATVLKSVAIYPGADKNAYLGIGGASQVQSRDSTMGLPNSAQNSLFWRSIREPQWSSTGNIPVDIQPDGNLLTWTASEEVNDNLSGYTIIRYRKSEVAGVIHPSDGTIYGSHNEYKLGTAKFIKNVVNITTYKDKSDMPCGDEYEYRVYAYRFNTGDYPEEAKEVNARGRSYNTNTYAVMSFKKIGPATPKLLVDNKEIALSNDTVLVCMGSTAKLQIKDDAAKQYQYTWYKSDKKIEEATTKFLDVQYTNTITEQYYGAIYDATANCYVYTNKVIVKYLIVPKINIAVENKVLANDTTIYICKNDSKAYRILSGSGYDEKEYKWYLNNTITKQGAKNIAANQNGIYQLKASNSGTCTAESYKITIVLTEPEFTVTPSSLTYSLSATESYLDKKVTIENKKDYPLVIKEFGRANSFQVASPTLPVTIPAFGTQEFTIRYLPASSGKVTELLKCYAVCGDTNTPVVLNVEGTKVPSLLSIDKSNIVFDTLLTCENKEDIDVVTLTNKGSEAIIINKPTIAAPFEVIEGTFPITLSKLDDKLAVKIKFKNSTMPAADYKQDLKIPYTVGGVNYEILVALSGVIAEPELEFEYPEVADTTVIPITTFTDDIITLQYDIEVKNSGNRDITITKPANYQGITFDFAPTTIAAGASDVIKVTVNHSGVTPTEYPFTLNTNPCGKPYHLKLVCSTTGFVIDSVINYGYIAKCPSRIDPKVEEITIKVLGTPESPFITDIVHSENFKLEIADGTPVSDGMKKIKVEFIGNAVKKYDEELKFTIKPMDKVYTIRVKAEVFEPTFEHYETLYFDNVKPNNKLTKSLRIINSNHLPIRLTSISNPVPSGVFSTDADTMVLKTIPPGDSIWIKFAYAPIADGEDRAQVRMKFEIDDCVYEDVVFLNGNTGQSIPLEVKFQAPTIVRLGTTINIPTYAKLDTTKGVQYLQAAIKKVEFDIEFNGSVLLPIEIVPESSLIEAKNLVLTRIDDNSAKGSFDMSSRNMQDGKFFSIRSKFLWGNDTKAEIKLKNFKVVEAAKKFSVKDDSATIKIIGDCAFETGLLKVGEASGLGVTPRINSIDIEYHLVAEDYSTLEIYDAMGKNVYYNEVTNKQGAYSLSINQQLSNGTYIAILRNGNFPRIVKFVVNQ